MKLTKQGVRDLGGNNTRKKREVVPQQCEHKRLRERYGHFECPDCGLAYDTHGGHDITVDKC